LLTSTKVVGCEAAAKEGARLGLSCNKVTVGEPAVGEK